MKPTTPWNSWSQTATNSQTRKLTVKTSTVRFRVWTTVGQDTLRRSETASATKRRIRLT